MQITAYGIKNCLCSVLSVFTASRGGARFVREHIGIVKTVQLRPTSVVGDQVLLSVGSQRTTVTNEGFEDHS